MIYLLDTNACIGYLRIPRSAIGRRLAQLSPGDIAVSAITVVELFRGAYRSMQVADTVNRVSAFLEPLHCLALDRPAAAIAGQIDAHLTGQGLRIGPYDTLIAASALAHNLVLVTHNTREFERVPGLRLEDWEA